LPNNKELVITSLLDLSLRLGRDPLLTQASTGNTSVKIDGVLWIKASGKWLADAKHGNFLIPVDLAGVKECVRLNIDPVEKCSSTLASNLRASIETAMHAVLPHAVVVHVHSVNAIAWAAREDAPARLKCQLQGLRWQWIPYVASGLPLAQAIEEAVLTFPRTDVLVLGNHGLVIGGEDCDAAEALLNEVERRLMITPRLAPQADYPRLTRLAGGSPWRLPDDAALHALGTDPIARRILSGGLLYPCQSIFSNSTTPALFRSVPGAGITEPYEIRYAGRPFLIIEDRGTLVAETITPAEYAMLSGLAQVVQRIDESAPIRYLRELELTGGLNLDAYRYRQLADMDHDRPAMSA
jgi:rhamnose utilization protein RhaD (predicted bifunctional aldolase and dehydrogenase)